MLFPELKEKSRLILEAELRPLTGTRFQPTGFPDLGAATYKLPGSGVEMLLVESAQSIANRLESTIWDPATQKVVEPLGGISYVVVRRGEEVLTNSLLEAHRLNSYYILEGKDRSFFNRLQGELAAMAEAPVDYHKLAVVLARYDVNCLLHGVFLAKKELAGGRFKLPRALSGFIEACNVATVSMGGVKNDRVNPSGDTAKGGGNVPYHREEYTAERIVASFSLDLSQIRSYRLGEAAEDLLITLALWKIQRFLAVGLRLRSNCDLECLEVKVKKPAGFELPDFETLTGKLIALVTAATAAGLFADPPVTEVNYEAEVAEKTEKPAAGGRRGR